MAKTTTQAATTASAATTTYTSPDDASGQHEAPVMPEVYQAAFTDMPKKLVSCSTTAQGKVATIQVETGEQRQVLISGPKDAWHQIFGDLGVADHQVLREFAAIKTPLSDGTVKVQSSPVSFATENRTKRGRYLSFDDFDVQATDYLSGAVAGFEALSELLHFAKGDAGNRDSFLLARRALCAAGQAALDRGRSDAAEGRRAVGLAFIDGWLEFLPIIARNTNFDEVLTSRIAKAERTRDQLNAVYAKERADRRTRMAEARKAKLKTTREVPQ